MFPQLFSFSSFVLLSLSFSVPETVFEPIVCGGKIRICGSWKYFMHEKEKHLLPEGLEPWNPGTWNLEGLDQAGRKGGAPGLPASLVVRFGFTFPAQRRQGRAAGTAGVQLSRSRAPPCFVSFVSLSLCSRDLLGSLCVHPLGRAVMYCRVHAHTCP